MGLCRAVADVVPVEETPGLAWSRAGPEAGDAVVGAGGEDVA